MTNYHNIITYDVVEIKPFIPDAQNGVNTEIVYC